MLYSGTGYSVNNGIRYSSYATQMYGNNPGYNPNITRSYLCNTVNVIDMSGMIRKRVDCTPVYNPNMYRYRSMY